MSRNQIRASQIITTFGPGSMVDFPDSSVMIAGLDKWNFGPQGAHQVIEPRLVAKLRHYLSMPDLSLRLPPPAADERDQSRPDVIGWRFPGWFIVQAAESSARGFRRRRMVHGNSVIGNKFRDQDRGNQSVVPVRFVRACRRGHIGDINWKAFVLHHDGVDCVRDLWIEERGTSGELEDVFVVCDCGLERTIGMAARRELRALGACDGSRPWLGPKTREKCGEPNRLLIRSASNAWFPQLFPVISIPDSAGPLDGVVQELWEDFLEEVETAEKLARVRQKPTPRVRLEPWDDAAVLKAIERVRKGGSGALDRPVKEVEFEALSEARDEMGSETVEGDFHARALPSAAWSGHGSEPIERVVLVHRLREVVALVGFTRFEASGTDIHGELALDVTRAPLAINARWLPAIENRGEGIFLQFRAESIAAWLERPEVAARGRELETGFEAWKKEHENAERPFPGLPYYLLHSFSHLLITAISLECGYPASSLRERIYAADGCHGILIYTGSTDAEGTLGGLVLAGRDLGRHLRRALEAGALCSNDPICAFHNPSREGNQPLQGAACHGCVLISESSCEQRNDFLDRALVVSTLKQAGAELFPEGAR